MPDLSDPALPGRYRVRPSCKREGGELCGSRRRNEIIDTLLWEGRRLSAGEGYVAHVTCKHDVSLSTVTRNHTD